MLSMVYFHCSSPGLRVEANTAVPFCEADQHGVGGFARGRCGLDGNSGPRLISGIGRHPQRGSPRVRASRHTKRPSESPT